ncbi:ATP-binding protein [Mycobacterium sp. 141]|uniref:AAA family ATPase n=1 Tax=Mycobacterium sp. 141 TaxID=1120797 RepID=UPI0012DFCDDF|nr:ATP-binding protein [Mycobacterium sp. 141]
MLEDFATARKNAQEFTRGQTAGVSRFWDPRHSRFFRNEKERVDSDVVASDPSAAATDNTQPPENTQPPVDDGPPPRPKPKRLTSTVTCLESLLEAPDSSEDSDKDFSPAWAHHALVDFMRLALTPMSQWESDEAAWVYCRVRTLGGALRLINGGITVFNAEQQATARQFLREAWDSRDDTGGAFGLRERTSAPDSESAPTEEGYYPPNAFLTYWGLLAADAFSEHEAGPVVSDEEKFAAYDWLRANLGFQIAMHYIGSTHADPQQLAWSLCGLVRFGPDGVLGNSVSADRQLLVAGLRAFFQQQRNKTWSIGAPLFHFRTAGNAYSYIYETLAELISLATSRDLAKNAAEALAAALREHSQEMLLALEYAEETSQYLGDDSRGWSSGHHPHRDSPECWATASVYRFGQALRRLFGMWSSAAAKAALDARRPSGGLADLGDRGETWNLGKGTAGVILATTYVHPTCLSQQRMEARTRFHHDPDRQLLDETQARSAMLFGPPGTGKTALAEFVASAIGWDFIEVTPAQFLDQGVDHVSARADAIFRQIMELDRCVVLFDEIDELIRNRSGETESIERFFTTTMLPRLAKMWSSRRVLFFVNTNNIAKVDTAIARSQRFDRLVFVLPPDYPKKKRMLAKAGITLNVENDKINNALLDRAFGSNAEKRIGWFAAIRYDQMGALVAQLRGRNSVNETVLIEAMTPIVSELAQLDWEANLVNGEKLPDVESLHVFERQDARLWHSARIDADTFEPEGVEVATVGGTRWAVINDMTGDPQQWAVQRGMELTATGVLKPAAGQPGPDPEDAAGGSP